MKQLTLLLALAIFTGCATIINDNTEFVAIRTNPKGAKVETEGHSCTTPCSLQLQRGKSYVLRISKEGHEDKSFNLDGRSWDGWLWGNAILGGFIGLAVDFATDKAYDFDPEYVETNLKSTNEAIPERTHASVKEK